jgi:hypothetical protein
MNRGNGAKLDRQPEAAIAALISAPTIAEAAQEPAGEALQLAEVHRGTRG